MVYGAVAEGDCSRDSCVLGYFLHSRSVWLSPPLCGGLHWARSFSSSRLEGVRENAVSQGVVSSDSGLSRH